MFVLFRIFSEDFTIIQLVAVGCKNRKKSSLFNLSSFCTLFFSLTTTASSGLSWRKLF